MRGSAEYTCRRARSLSSLLGMMCCDALQASSCVVMLIPPNAAAMCPWPGWSQRACYGLHNVQFGRNLCNITPAPKKNSHVHALFM